MKIIEQHLNTNNLGEIKEDRSIVTNYAFSVSDVLLNKPLASPYRRFLAITIDAGIVILLSIIPSYVLYLILAASLFKFGLNDKLKVWVRRILYTVSFLILLGVAWIGYSVVVDMYVHPSGIRVVSTDGLGRDIAAIHNCKDATCRNKVVEDYINKRINLPPQLADSGAKGFLFQHLNILEVNAEERQRIISYANSKILNLNTAGDVFRAVNDDLLEMDYMAWVGVFFGALGLSFGWAAVYFSCLTSWAKGKTIGKFILGIRVVNLNGDSPNLWDSFGRFGGYSAGIATGLLGFAQILWDANRQAIQDKVAETLVILDR